MKNQKGKNNPNWKGGKTKTKCYICKKTIYKKQYNYRRSKRHYCSNICRIKDTSKYNNQAKEEKNGMWKGNKVGCVALHYWIKKRLKKTNLCQKCKKVPSYDLANISPKYNKKTYNRDLKNWEWLCRKCHMIKDGRLKNFINNRYLPNKLYEK